MVDPLVLRNELTEDVLTLNHISEEPYLNCFALSIESVKLGKSAILLTPVAMARLNSYYWDIIMPYLKPKLSAGSLSKRNKEKLFGPKRIKKK